MFSCVDDLSTWGIGGVLLGTLVSDFKFMTVLTTWNGVSFGDCLVSPLVMVIAVCAQFGKLVWNLTPGPDEL